MSFPLSASTARARSSRTFSSRRPTKRLPLHPAAPVRTAAAPKRPFYANRSPGRLAQLFFLHAAPSRLPVVREPDVHRTNRGARPQADRGRGPVCLGRHALGAAAVRTASPTRSRQLSPRCRAHDARPSHVHAADSRTRLAAGRSVVLLLVPQRAAVRFHQAGRWRKSYGFKGEGSQGCDTNTIATVAWSDPRRRRLAIPRYRQSLFQWGEAYPQPVNDAHHRSDVAAVVQQLSRQPLLP